MPSGACACRPDLEKEVLISIAVKNQFPFVFGTSVLARVVKRNNFMPPMPQTSEVINLSLSAVTLSNCKRKQWPVIAATHPPRRVGHSRLLGNLLDANGHARPPQSDVLLANKYSGRFGCGDSCPQYWRELWWWAIRSVQACAIWCSIAWAKRTPSSPPPFLSRWSWDELAAGRFRTCPLIAFAGLVTHEASGRRAAGVQIYGVDERFWRFHASARRNCRP